MKKFFFLNNFILVILFVVFSQFISAQNKYLYKNDYRSLKHSVLSKNELKYNIKSMPKGVCDTVNYYAYQNVWSIVEYSVAPTSGSGFVNGTNSNGDLAKAAYFPNTSAYPYILGCNIAFSTAYSSNPNKTITVSVCSVSGGNPGTVLASKTVTMQQIMSNVNSGYFTSVMFNNPVNTSNAAFFIVVDYSTLYWNSDSLSIQSNQSGETVPSATWEKQSDYLWYHYNTTYSWALDISLAVFPFMTDIPADAAFTQSTTSTCTGVSVNYNASTSTQNSVHWVFQGGTPATSNTVNQAVTYSNPGTFTTKLYVWGGSCNNIDSLTSSITIAQSPSPAATAIPNAICNGSPSVLTAYNGIYYQWTGFTANQNPITVYPNSNTAYTVVVTASNGCTATQNVNVTVYQNPNPNLTTANLNVCDSSSTLITAATGFNLYQWNIPGSSAAIVVYPTLSNSIYSVTVTDSHTCTASDTVTFNVYSLPVTPIITQTGDTIFSSASTGNQWYNSFGLISGATGNKYVPTTSGYYYVIVTDQHGCISDSSNIIYLIPTGVSDFNVKKITVFSDISNQSFSIKIDGFENKNVQIYIYNMQGKSILNYTTYINSSIFIKQFNTNFKMGIYYMKLISDSDVFVNKFLIQSKN